MLEVKDVNTNKILKFKLKFGGRKYAVFKDVIIERWRNSPIIEYIKAFAKARKKRITTNYVYHGRANWESGVITVSAEYKEFENWCKKYRRHFYLTSLKNEIH